MLKSSAAAVSSITDENSSGYDQTKDDSGQLLPVIPCEDDPKLGDPDVSPKKRKQKLPKGVRPWGFVRHLNDGETLAAEASKTVKVAERDATLWWDEERGRFLIAVEKSVVDDLSPLQFVQLVRQWILFKYERRHDGSTGGVYRVWA